MKRILLILVCIGLADVAFAQRNTLVSASGVNMLRGQNQSELRLEFCGYGITLENNSFRQAPRVAPTQNAARAVQWGIGFNRVEFGFSLLAGASYAGYASEERDFLDPRLGKSIHFGFRFLNFGAALNRQRSIYFRTGVHLMCDNYTFSRNITVRREGDYIVPVPLDEKYKKSKLMTVSFGIPLQFCYSSRQGFHFSVLAYGDLVAGAHTKYKKPKNRANFSDVNLWQCGVGATVSFRGFGLYAKYGLTPLFRSGVGPKAYPVTVGLYFGR